MREIEASRITEVVAQLCMDANFELGEDVIRALERALSEEESPSGIEVLKSLLENAEIASEERIAKFLVVCATQTASIRIGPCQLGCF